MKMEITTDPLELFSSWLDEAKSVCKNNPNAISLATANKEGIPDVRYVLLKNITSKGFEFFTNRTSTKATQIFANPHTAFAIYWRELGKQIRVQGQVVELDKAEIVAYFKTRSRNSQLGAWASNQSSTLSSMQDLLDEVKNFEEKFQDQEITLPDHWTGFLLQPETIEFWQEGADRIHERIRYFRDNLNDNWQHTRLFP